MTLKSSSTTARNLSLAGGISGDFGGSANNRNVTIGNSTAPVNIDLNGSIGSSWNANTGDTLTATNVVSDGSLAKSGAGMLILSGADTFTGGLTVRANIVGLVSTSAAGTGTITLGDSSGSANTTLNFGASGTFTNAIAVALGNSGIATVQATTGSPTVTGAITLNSHNLTIGNSATSALNIGGGVTGSGNLTLNSSNSGTISFVTNPLNNNGSIVNSGNGTGGLSIGAALGANVTSLTQNASSSPLTLTAANTAFAGAVNIGAGILKNGNASALSVSNVVSVSSGATLDLNNNSLAIAGLNDGTGAGVVTTIATGTTSRTLTLGGGGSYSFGGALADGSNSGHLAVTKSGVGTQTLTGISSYGGGTTISAGTLRVSGGSAIPANSALTMANTAGALLDVNGSSQTIGSITGGGSAGGNVILGGGGTSVGELSVGANNTSPSAFNGIISGTDSLTKIGTGTITLGGVNTFSAGTTISGGTLQVTNDAALASGAITMNGGDLKANGTHTLANPVTLDTTTSSTVEVPSGTFTLSGNLTGSGNLTKLGAGSVLLSGDNSSYTGTTTLSVGQIQAGADHAFGTGSIVLNGGVLANAGGKGGLAGTWAETGSDAAAWVGVSALGAAATLEGGAAAGVTQLGGATSVGELVATAKLEATALWYTGTTAGLAAANGESGAGQAPEAASTANTQVATDNPLFRPGPFAAKSIPAQSAAQTFTGEERAAINNIGYDTGCHSCGTTDPGTVSGNFVPDHQPVSVLNTDNAPQQLYPQCLNCSRLQGLAAARAQQAAQRATEQAAQQQDEQ